ncbi:hypothetical protein CDD83_62 [Cordyceps sp. RAO-2017]|nr:hypothetical protein CDD83_62 [Cordyceps sp. RAO-2017]
MSNIDMSSFRGIGMVVLQVLRAFTVITLAAVGASCWVLIIKVDKERGYFVFECAVHFFRSLLCLALIVSEFPVLESVKGYFRRNWPVVSDQRGLSWLGVAMLALGCDMLGNLNRPAYDADKLGPHFSRLTLASSVLAITFGTVNIVCSLVWRDRGEGITCRDIRDNGSLADARRQSLPDYSSATYSNNPSSAATATTEKMRSRFASVFWKKAGGDKEKMKHNISGPFPVRQQDVERQATPPCDNDRLSPIVPGLKRPDTALHPMNTNTNGGRSSVYSEAHMSRF